LETSAEASRPQLDFQHAEANEEERREQDEQQEEEGEENEDDEDIWLDLAQGPTPYSKRNAAPRQEPAIEPPRRSKISSQWRQNRQRRLYGDELDQHPDNNAAPQKDPSANEEEEPSMVVQDRVEQVPVRFERNEARNDDEEYSLLSRSRDKRAAGPVSQLAKKPDLLSFFSSPAVVPDLQEAPGVGMFKTLNSRRAEQADPAVPKPRTMPVQRPQASGNSLFAQDIQPQTQTQLPLVPHKQLEIGTRPRSVDLFSPVRKIVERSSLELVSPSASPESPEARPAPTLEKLGFTGRAVAPVARIASPETPEKAVTPDHIFQKKNFTPRRRGSNNTLFQPKPKPVVPAASLFDDSNQISAFFSISRPRSQRPRVRPREDEYEDEESNPARAQLKPPPRAASPGKSSFRSPLKPKTPGRMVEFTSSTLSPLTQAQARAERRASISPEKEDRPQGRGRGRPDIIEADKENHSSTSSLSPSPSPSPVREQHRPFTSRPTTTTQPTPPTSTTSSTSRTTTTTTTTQHQPLSSKTWTRPHWLRLDELLQARKRGALPLQLELARGPSSAAATTSSSPPRTASGTRPGTGSCRHLLGKQVSAQGESMILEGWHLDVVEGFLGELVADYGSSPAGGGAGRGGYGYGYDEEGEEEEEEERGWDGVQIAKRVFALLVGEERRRLGLVPQFREWSGLE
jgi:hypothetical protein